MRQHAHLARDPGEEVPHCATLQHRSPAGGEPQIGGDVHGLAHPARIGPGQALHRDRRCDRAPGAVRMHGGPEAGGDADPGADLVADRDRGDQIAARGPMRLGEGEGGREGVDAGMAAAELVALVHLQPSARGAVQQRRLARWGSQASADHAGRATGRQALRERGRLRLGRPARNGADAVGDDQLGAVHRLRRQFRAWEIGCKLGDLGQEIHARILRKRHFRQAGALPWTFSEKFA